ncbi:hypothetical protein ACVHNB_36115 [Streptomyces sp. YJ-C3]
MTVQLDGAGRQLGARLGMDGQPGAPTAPPGDGKEVPVFVDDSGRRSRTFRRVGVMMGIACAVYAVVIVVTLLSGNSSAPWLPMPDDKGPAGQVDTKPVLPAESAAPSASPGGTPDPSASGTASGAEATPGGSEAPSTGTSPDDDRPGAGTESPGKPADDRTTPPAKPSEPGKNTTPPADPSTPPADPSTPPVEPSDPATEPVGGGAEAGTVAVGALSALIAQSLGAEPTAPFVASLESSVL